MSELYHQPKIQSFICSICHAKIGDIDLHMRTYHPSRPVFFVSKRAIADQSTLADVCNICGCDTNNILAHVHECHPDKYKKWLGIE